MSRLQAEVAFIGDAAPAKAEGMRSRMAGYAWYVAGALAVAHVVSIMDRYLLSVVLEQVKAGLSLSDTELGVLQGPVFVLLFAAASLPLGRLADSASRKWMIVAAITFRSGATIASGLSHSFPQLLPARLAVGLGEAALVPAAMSLIAAMFAPDRLSRPISIYTTGGSLGRAAGARPWPPPATGHDSTTPIRRAKVTRRAPGDNRRSRARGCRLRAVSAAIGPPSTGPSPRFPTPDPSPFRPACHRITKAPRFAG